ncbi:MAG: hypothetical protein AAF518_04965 [Spirochaetota bacterium]
MKKIILLSTLSFMMLFTISCTRTKKKIDWVTTFLFYELVGKQQSVGNACRVTISDNNVACKKYDSGFTADEETSDCTGNNTFSGTLSSYVSGTANSSYVTNGNCDTTDSIGTCSVSDSSTGQTATITLYSAFGSDNLSGYCSSLGGTLTTN